MVEKAENQDAFLFPGKILLMLVQADLPHERKEAAVLATYGRDDILLLGVSTGPVHFPASLALGGDQ